MLGAASDENGYYIIKDIPIGKYTLKAMFIGYETLENEIWIEGDQKYQIDIQLTPSIIEIEETRVTSSKRKEKNTEAPASIEIISSRDIKRETTTNMGSYLKGLKGVDFTSSGINNYSISIRGFNSSFNTRVLTLTDGRVANIPALRVINYSAVPQSMDDVDRMEVVLGPATALYGANAHSGVVNIISKSPSQSEGLNMGVSGSYDERQLRKINARWAKKLSKRLSIKLSGTYLHAYEWPYLSETEYKAHSYPWAGHPNRSNDGKDNNPWNANLDTLNWDINNVGETVRIGNGEAMDTGDPDNDGVMGEDWFNGYDDDGDGLIDEDYFTANGIDDDGDGLIDENIDYISDIWNDGYDNDSNGIIDENSERELWGTNIEQNNIIIKWGRGDSLINGKSNPWFITNYIYQSDEIKPHLKGSIKYDENKMKYIFDIFIYDYGEDHMQGFPYIDKSGDNNFQKGECLGQFGYLTDNCDLGLDGIPNTNDFGENDNLWQPGDGWIDNNNNGFPDEGNDSYIEFNVNNYNDVWPPPNRYWDQGEELFIDINGNNKWDENETILSNGIPKDGYQGDPFIDENNNGKKDGNESFWDLDGNKKYSYPTGEFDGVFDTGDGIYGFSGESFDDSNSNGIWDQGELYSDSNNDGMYTPPDYTDEFQTVFDINGDGISDYPDFEVENRKIDFRLDYDFSKDINMTLQGGYSWTKTQQVTGTSRYLADGFEYTYYQLRGRYKKWYSQFYMNQSYSGNTRSYNLGNIVEDRSKNYAFQIQHNDKLLNFNTDITWGLDYFKTLPRTNGTILNDGPNGYDNDGDNLRLAYDGLDQDGDGENDDINGWCINNLTSHYKNGRIWECGEGIDEPDEFDNPNTNEYGLYFQTKTELFGTSRYEIITAARWDYHDILSEGIQFAPKVGFIYKPDEKSSLRFTYGKAFNTPNSITLYTDLFIRNLGIFDVFLRGNKDGTPYCRVGETCSNSNESFSGSIPGYWDSDADSLIPASNALNPNYFSGYNDRIKGAPYFYNLEVGIPIDMIPLDTSRYLIFIPELNDNGVLYSPKESINLPNIDPIKTEKIQTFELGYKGFINRRTHISIDYYLSYYKDFFSPPTFITPSVVLREFDNDGNDITNLNNLNLVGMMPINSFDSNPPYGTAWDGIDNDYDWLEWSGNNNKNTNFECLSEICGFNWINDDKDQDGNFYDQEAGEWGLVYWHTAENDIHDTLGYYIYHPDAIIEDNNMNFIRVEESYNGNTFNVDFNFADAVGVDEYHPVIGFNEAEMIPTGLLGPNGEQLEGPGVAMSPPHLILSPMNYGNVWMQGLDLGVTQFFPEYNLVIDGNISWYGTTEYYNKLTRKNDPINAPKWKWNGSIKWDSILGAITLNYRHVNKFKWNDGIWSGFIGPYDIFDIHYNYKIFENLSLSISAQNIFNDKHKELIGGAKIGRQINFRLESTF